MKFLIKLHPNCGIQFTLLCVIFSFLHVKDFIASPTCIHGYKEIFTASFFANFLSFAKCIWLVGGVITYSLADVDMAHNFTIITCRDHLQMVLAGLPINAQFFPWLQQWPVVQRGEGRGHGGQNSAEASVIWGGRCTYIRETGALT